MAPSWDPGAVQKSAQVAHAGRDEPQPLGQERPRAAQERSQGHLGGILARSGTGLEGKIVIFHCAFQYFLNNVAFNKICALRPSGCPTWNIFGGQERPKSAPRAAKSGPRAPKSGPRAPKRGPRAAQERPRSGQERPRVAKSGPRTAEEQPRGPKGAQERPQSGKKCPKRAPTGKEKLETNSDAIHVRIGTSRDEADERLSSQLFGVSC